MKSIKDETDQLYAIISKFENATNEAESISKEADCGIRDYGKKGHAFEMELETSSMQSSPSLRTPPTRLRASLKRLTAASAITARRCTPSRWSWRPPSTS